MKRVRPNRKPLVRKTHFSSNGIEPLESRQLMSTTVLASAVLADTSRLATTVLTPAPTYYVDGTAGNDNITVSYMNSPYTGRRLTIQRNAEPAYIAIIGASDYIQIRGLDGNDFIRFIGSANVAIHGNAGNDSIVGGSGSDVLFGDDGNDNMDGGTGGDTFYGGAGIDYADYSTRTNSIFVTMDQLSNDGEMNEKDSVMSDTEGVKGGAGNDVITGGDASNYFYGNGGDDLIHGGNGLDFIRGGAGNDRLYADAGFHDDVGGDAGNDKIYGGSGPDYLRGGDGDDTIISIGGSQVDYVWGEGGTDSFWLDAESTEQLFDASSFENSRNVHRVANFEPLKMSGSVVEQPSRELLGQNLADPTPHKSSFTYKRFSDTPLYVDDAGPTADDVNQGQIGDCYFLAPLSAIAKTSPNVIRQSVVELGDGTYAVEMRRDGGKRYIRVDADMPVDGAGNMVYAHWANTDPQMWVPVMEKAWALFRNSTGCYSGIDFGQAKEPFNALGISNDDYDPYSWFNDSPQEFGNNLASYLNQGKAVTLCTGSGAGILAESHCYMVDHVEFVNGLVSAVVLRNPWGTDGPSGDSSNDGYVRLTAAQALSACELIVYGQA